MVIVSPRASSRAYDTVRTDNEDDVEHRRELAEAINNILTGKVNAVTTVTLTISSATTILNDARIGPNSFIGFTPITANAAAEIPTLYVSSRGDQTATLTHVNSAVADRTYVIAILG